MDAERFRRFLLKSCFHRAPLHVRLYIPRTYYLLFIFLYLTPMFLILFSALNFRVAIIITNQSNRWHIHLKSSCTALTRLLTTFKYTLVNINNGALSSLKTLFVNTLFNPGLSAHKHVHRTLADYMRDGLFIFFQPICWDLLGWIPIQPNKFREIKKKKRLKLSTISPSKSFWKIIKPKTKKLKVCKM